MKKAFFKTRTEAEIKSLRPKYIINNLAKQILALKDDEAVIIPDLIPEEYKDSRDFMKHAPDIKIKRFSSLEEIVRYGKYPFELREKAMNKLGSPFHSVYSIRPLGIDRVIREISPTACVDGVQLYAYSRKGSNITITPYDDSSMVERDGVKVYVSVPSRTEHRERYEFIWQSIPVIDNIDNNNKHSIALAIQTVGHACGDKLFNKELAYSRRDERESSKRVTFCAHEVAAYIEICDHYKNHKDKNKKSIIPLQMSQFLILSKLAARYNYLVKNNLLIRTEDGELKKADEANRNILFFELLKIHKYKDIFYSHKSRDGDLVDYKW